MCLGCGILNWRAGTLATRCQWSVLKSRSVSSLHFMIDESRFAPAFNAKATNDFDHQPAISIGSTTSPPRTDYALRMNLTQAR